MAKKQFKSESKRLLDLMVNSIYTHKEIFLRELISNASDAIDKLCFISLTDDKVGLSRSDFKIEIVVDKDNRTITIKDNGIGMNKDELENNLGTIASSGSYKFRQELTEENKNDVDIIGQFGVGFYSAFMVAKKITVLTKKYGEEQAYKWESTGADGYSVTEIEKESVGSTVILEIKEDSEEENYSEFLHEYKISSLIKKYSDYIRYPILMDVEHQHVKEGTEGENPEYETVTETQTLNSMVPIWQRPKKDVSQEEYDKFYQEKFFDFEKPLHTIVTSVEGVVTYKALLFIPAKTPYDYYTKEYKAGLQLYSSGVLIMENCEELLPEHFRFVKGIVDTQDLSLNISRELLQHDRQLKTIAQNIEKKIKSELVALFNNDRDTYNKFFESFGRQLKYGIVSNYGIQKDNLKDLIMFYSSAKKAPVTLNEYVENMKENQKYIYYAAGKSVDAIDKLPQIETVLENGFEILYLTDEIDEFAMQTLRTYNDKEIRSVTNSETEIEDKNTEDKPEENDGLIKFVKETLGDKVKDVVASKKLKSHPVCLTAQGAISFEMEKYFSQMGQEGAPKAEKVLELNMSHPAVEAMKSAIDTDFEKAKKYAELLYCQSLLIAGLPLENPSEYADLVCSLF